MIRSKWVGAALAAALVFGLTLAAPVLAVDGNNTLSYRGGAQGRVIFDGRTHAAKGLACNSCHSALFPTQRTGLITLQDHSMKTKCWACHDGTQAFSTCASCHRGPSN
jgi:phosphate transport system substrate-binding protein